MACRNHRRWKVRKLDGCWWVFDERGLLRYASADFVMALSFSLMQPILPTMKGIAAAELLRMGDEVRKTLEQTDYGDDE